MGVPVVGGPELLSLPWLCAGPGRILVWPEVTSEDVWGEVDAMCEVGDALGAVVLAR